MGFSQTIQKIEAESFNTASGAKAENNAALSGGKNVGYIKNNTWISFTGHVFNQYDTSFNIAAAGATGGTIELRLGSSTGTLIGTVTVSGSTSFSDYKMFSTTIIPTTGTHDLFLVFKHPTNTGYLFNLDYLEKVTTIPGAITYTLATNVSPVASGTVSSNPGGGNFVDGTAITVTANKNFGYNFVRWTDGNGNPVSTANPYTFTITSNSTLVAEYAAVNTYTLSVNVAGAFGLGEYTVSPAGKDGAFSVYETGTNVTITAVENDIIKFNNWSDGSTALSASVPMTENRSITGTYDNATFIAGWTFKNDQYANPRVAELYSNVDNRPQISAYNVADNVFAPNVRLQNRGGKNGFCVWNTDRGNFFYFMTSFSTVGYKNINVSSGLIGLYYGCDEWTFQYSLDGVNFIDISSLTTINKNTITPIGGTLPVEAEGKAKVYLRWFPNVAGPKHGLPADGITFDVTATVLSNVIVKADEVLVIDTIAPILQSTLPAAASTTVGTFGKIILAFDEKVQIAPGTTATLGSKTLTPEVVGKTISFPYVGLDYNTNYTFTLTGSKVSDLSGNTLTTPISFSFSTLNKPTVTKKRYDFIVGVDGDFAAAKAAAIAAAPSGNRFFIFLPNGNYDLGLLTGDAKKETKISTPNISLIGQSMDKTILFNKPLLADEGFDVSTINLTETANNIYMQDLTLMNNLSYGTGEFGGRGLALENIGNKNILKNVALLGNQDTFFTAGQKIYLENGEIHGTVDFIYGSSDAYFKGCLLYLENRGGNVITAASTPATGRGFVFSDCTIDGADINKGTYSLGRPWHDAPQVVFINTKMNVLPKAEGWSAWGTLPKVYAEYNSMTATGGLVDLTNRKSYYTNYDGGSVTLNPVLTPTEAANYTVENVLGSDGWQPNLYTDQITAPVVTKTATSLTWADNNYVLGWAIFKNDIFVDFLTTNSYNFTATGTYKVRAANSMGGLGTASNEINVNCFGASANPISSAANSTEVNVGSTLQLSHEITGGSWTSSATDKATIDANGLVSGLAIGTTTITYTLCNNSVTKEIVVIAQNLDNDNDGVNNSLDLCPNTPAGETVNASGCSASQLDDDNDGVKNNLDLCSNTPTGASVNASGCAQSQLDDDNDGVKNNLDLCSNTPTGASVNASGCSSGQLDDDNDGVKNNLDTCPNTPTGQTVNASGCAQSQLDDDNDGVKNNLDTCSNTPTGQTVNVSGCAQSQLDDDNDGVKNNLDTCPNTPTGETVTTSGCSSSQLDDDNDGVKNNKDLCLNTTSGATVDINGCFTLPSDNFTIETVGETCAGKKNGKIIITAKKALNYTTVINGVTYSFTTAKTIENVPPGIYDFCIDVASDSYKQCFNVVVESGTNVSAKTTMVSDKLSVDIEQGTAPYTVLVNGKNVLETTASSFSVDVNPGDVVQLQTAIACEGIINSKIDVSGVIAFPNPTKGLFEIAVPVILDKVKVEVFDVNSQLISSDVYKVNNGKVQMNLENRATGGYFVKVYLDELVILKIIKQ
ncbi:hypothetical protein GCM10008015_05590 [Flavobacterium palustre]|uniref:CBM6 domain-containing protein n=2 Tax=Flavobacterium palustre TaxID=1476463 RepID=A0ABQ1HA53_9FLAO|nr:hypothetical protein GCM10008015_05590 [Flavobacterium palustre]